MKAWWRNPEARFMDRGHSRCRVRRVVARIQRGRVESGFTGAIYGLVVAGLVRAYFQSRNVRLRQPARRGGVPPRLRGVHQSVPSLRWAAEGPRQLSGPSVVPRGDYRSYWIVMLPAETVAVGNAVAL